MLATAITTAASGYKSPPRGSLAGAPVEARAPASPLDGLELPIWAMGEYARQLLERIIEERPERTRIISDPATFGYAGRTASHLRAVFEVFADDRRTNWVGGAEHGSPLYRKRRNALIAYEASHGADALIERVLQASA